MKSLILTQLLASALAVTNWPERIVAPYLNAAAQTQDVEAAASDAMLTGGISYFILSHINADAQGTPSWLGADSLESRLPLVENIRANGGDVIVSFGGSHGVDLAENAETPQALAALYQSVIDMYDLSFIDVDIDGTKDENAVKIKKQAEALALLKETSKKDLKISVTLSANVNGFDVDSQFIVESFLAASFSPDLVNLLTLDFENVENPDSAMGSYVISAATGAYKALKSLNFSSSVKVGVSPMIGQNDIANEVFQLADAAQISKWAIENSWLGLISFWSIERDNGDKSGIANSTQIDQSRYEFSQIFSTWVSATFNSSSSTDTPFIDDVHVGHGDSVNIPVDESLPVANSSDVSRAATCTPLTNIAFDNPATGSRIQNWNQCTQYYHTCNPGYVCCVAPGQSNNIATCRAAGQPDTTAGCSSTQPADSRVPAHALPPCAVNFKTDPVANPLPLLPPSGSYYFGIWWDNDDGDTPQNVNTRVQASKKFPMWQMNIPMSATALAVNYFDQVWSRPINLNTNAVFFVSIFPSCILPYVSTFAIETLAYRLKAITDTGRSVMVRYAPEMNGNWNPYQQDPINFVIGYRNFVTITRAITGTKNIMFVWSPNIGNGYPWGGVGDPSNPYAAYYPGDSYVDMVGLSVYHFGQWQPSGLYSNTDPSPGEFAGLIDSFVKMYAHKPFVVSETAGTTNMAAQDAYGNWYTIAGSDANTRKSQKQNWWRQIAAAVPNYPTFKAIMIFDYIKYEGATYRDFTVTGGTPGMNSPVGNDGAALDGPTLAAFRADIDNGVLGNVLWADDTVADWSRCPSSTSQCSSSSFICCFGSASDFSAGAKTCRPPTNCYGVSNNAVCNAKTDVCSSPTSKCCAGSASDLFAGVTKCSATCYTPVQQWTDCKIATDTCAVSTDQCCFGAAADLTAGKTTCRPSSNCYRSALVQPDANFQGGYNWASKVFAPFIDVAATPKVDPVVFSNAVGSSRYIFGFITAATDGTPAWSGSDSITKLNWLTSIQSIRLFGGDAIISFGGPSGTELALVAKTSKSLQINYQNVVDGYNIRWLDFYITGAALTDPTSINLRNQVLRAMQVSNPNLLISYTLPTIASGLTLSSLSILTSAINYGVRIDVVNLLTTSTSVATAVSAQLSNLGMTSKIGISPTIGTDSAAGTTFQVADATALVKWAKANTQVRLLSIWNVNRDTSAGSGVTQKDRQFSQAFVQYEN